MTLTQSAEVDLLISQHKWKSALSVLDSSYGNVSAAAALDDLTCLPRRCLCLTHLGRHRDALQLVSAPLARRRGWAAGWLAKAKVLLDLGRYQEALNAWKMTRLDRNISVGVPLERSSNKRRTCESCFCKSETPEQTNTKEGTKPISMESFTERRSIMREPFRHANVKPPRQ
jgi:hypothetical protein